MPRYAARRVLPATVDEVWAVLAEPERFAEWWPGIGSVEPIVRRALAPGALWHIEGSTSSGPSLRRRPQMAGDLLVLEVVPPSRVTFQLVAERIDVELGLDRTEDDEAAATLVVEAPRFIGVGSAFPSQALAKLAALVRREEPT
ncbi:MAG TPA: SRPBCC family protein [Gaiellaceae bacterium]|nr:SRPBCC family protein [Gaiellaceae bacterium]